MSASDDLLAWFDSYVTGQVDTAVEAARAPLDATIVELQGKVDTLQAKVVELVDDHTADLVTIGNLKQQIADDTALIADLRAQIAALQHPADPADRPGWRLVWRDEFDGPAVDAKKWNVRNDTYSKNEKSYLYARNAVVEGGLLKLIAKRETAPRIVNNEPAPRTVTSAYLDTNTKASWLYGRFEMRACWDPFKGAWPAFWLRCDGAPGEIDIMEAVGGWLGLAMTVHENTDGAVGAVKTAKVGYEFKPPADFKFTDMHVYAAEWEQGVVRYYVDDKLIQTVTKASLDNPYRKPAAWLDGPNFAKPVNIRLNLQVGGGMPAYYGNDLDASSVLPGTYSVDYVRVYQR